MPLFEYRCPVCGEVRDKLRRFEDRDEPVWCPCSQTLMERVEIARTSRPRFPGQVDPNRPWQFMPDHPPDDIGDAAPINRSR